MSDSIKNRNKWISILAVSLYILVILYSCKSSRLNESEKMSKFKSYLLDCQCKPDGGDDQVEYYVCKKNGGTVSFREYEHTIEEFYDPRGKQPTKFCPEK